MVKYDKKILAIGIAFIGLFILVIIGFTYAFFIAGVVGNPSATPTVIETSDLRLLFNDTEVIIMNDVLPGASATKTFTVTNIGNSKVYYDINIIDVTNTFINNELVYSLTSTNNGGTATNEVLPNVDGILLESIEIEPGITQTYTMTILFKETGENQNTNQGADFTGKLQINASKLISDEVIFGIEETTGNVAITKSKSVNLVGAYYGNVTCESGNETIAECSASNDKINILGKAAGETSIAVTESAKNLSVSYALRVLDVVLDLSETSGNVEKSSIKQVNITGSDYGTLTCETSDASKATCSIVGTTLNITGVELGTATITVRENVANKTATYAATITYPTIYNKILADNTELSDSAINFSGIAGSGLYYTSNAATYGEDNTTIYYYRGTVTNNWVSFGGFNWRIVRTTSEKGAKLIYSGAGTTTSSGFSSGTTAFNTEWTNDYSAGYTCNSSGYTGTQTNSLPKTKIDTWYNSNLSSYASYLSTTAIHCADRSSLREFLYYIGYDRISNKTRPTFACPSTNQSRYTVSTSTGNGYLTYPIALISSDELAYAGLVYSSPANINSYVMTNATAYSWWTMTPGTTSPSTSSNVGVVYNTGALNFYSAETANYAVRPATSLKPCIVVTGGDGTQANPYTISNSSC